MMNIPLQVHDAIYQHTLNDVVTVIGNGQFTGIRVVMRILPAEPYSGIRFIRRDITSMNNEITVSQESLNNSHGCITVTNRVGVRVASVDKLLGALLGLKIDNAVIVLDGPEVPEEQRQSIDGSGKTMTQLIEQVGVSTQSAFRYQNYAVAGASSALSGFYS